jgi:hypothetical protein
MTVHTSFATHSTTKAASKTSGAEYPWILSIFQVRVRDSKGSATQQTAVGSCNEAVVLER